jgi:hypothetical protein
VLRGVTVAHREKKALGVNNNSTIRSCAPLQQSGRVGLYFWAAGSVLVEQVDSELFLFVCITARCT